MPVDIDMRAGESLLQCLSGCFDWKSKLLETEEIVVPIPVVAGNQTSLHVVEVGHVSGPEAFNDRVNPSCEQGIALLDKIK